MAKSPFMTTDEVAALLRCSRRSVHELTRRRQIPHRIRPYGRACLFLEDEVRAWLDGCELAVSELAGGGRTVRPKS